MASFEFSDTTGATTVTPPQNPTNLWRALTGKDP
jgi:hypothetical protein